MIADWYYNKLNSNKDYWRKKCCLWTINHCIKTNLKEQKYFYAREILSPPEEYNILEFNKILEKSISNLDKLHRQIAKHYLFSNLTQEKIANRYNLSQPRINRIIKHIKGQLQKDLKYYVE